MEFAHSVGKINKKVCIFIFKSKLNLILVDLTEHYLTISYNLAKLWGLKFLWGFQTNSNITKNVFIISCLIQIIRKFWNFCRNSLEIVYILKIFHINLWIWTKFLFINTFYVILFYNLIKLIHSLLILISITFSSYIILRRILSYLKIFFFNERCTYIFN